MKIIDADGHINDHACGEEIAAYMPRGNRLAKLFPEFDHLHFRYLKQNRRATGNPSPSDWNVFLDQTGIAWTVLYPTAGLAVGRIMAPEWAVLACRAYNNWLFEKFLQKNSRLKGVALVPLQDVDAAVVELRRAVKELGMLGGMLPSNGEAIQGHLGNKIYWPLYEEAEKLGCALAVHVGCLHHLGLDAFATYYPAHALGHPFSLMIQAGAMLGHGVFDRFPKLRVAFLEGGATWVPQGTTNVEAMRQQLDASSRQLAASLDDRWKTYLALPPELYTPNQVPNPQSLEQALARYDQVARDPQYTALQARPEFQATLQSLRQLASVRTAANNSLQLPPPPR